MALSVNFNSDILGEYLPYSEDALFWDGTDGTTWHNKYPEKWAALNWDALGRF